VNLKEVGGGMVFPQDLWVGCTRVSDLHCGTRQGHQIYSRYLFRCEVGFGGREARAGRRLVAPRLLGGNVRRVRQPPRRGPETVTLAGRGPVFIRCCLMIEGDNSRESCEVYDDVERGI